MRAWVLWLIESTLGAFPNGPSRRRLIAWMTVARGLGYVGVHQWGVGLVPSYDIIDRVTPIGMFGVIVLLSGLALAFTSDNLRSSHWGRITAIVALGLNIWLAMVFYISGNWANTGQQMVVSIVLFGEATYVVKRQPG